MTARANHELRFISDALRGLRHWGRRLADQRSAQTPSRLAQHHDAEGGERNENTAAIRNVDASFMANL